MLCLIHSTVSLGKCLVCLLHVTTTSHLGKVEFKFLSSERCLVQLYSSAGCCFGVTEIDSYASEALKLLERHTLIVRKEERLEHFLKDNK